MSGGELPLTFQDLAGIDVRKLTGVDRRTAQQLHAAHIHTVLDLLLYYPRRYLDRTRQAKIGDLFHGDEATVFGTVVGASTRPLSGRRYLTDVVIEDDSGRLKLTFFNQRWRERQLPNGTEVLVYGKHEIFRGKSQMTSPVVDLVGDQTVRIVPVYPQSEKVGLTTYRFSQLISQALRRSQQKGIADPLPTGVIERFGFTSRQSALWGIHQPQSFERQGQARRRLVFDELLRVQVELVRRKQHLAQQESGIAHQIEGDLTKRFTQQLPFSLTRAQERVNAEIAADLSSVAPMHRLLQGDVGSGKTLVAVYALLIAVQGGYQGALMAPTEVLAEQHFLGLSDLLRDLIVEDNSLLGSRPLKVALLTSSLSAPARKATLAALQDGTIDIAVGTHSLISADVEYSALGMVVIDEQHRFGVEQREALKQKGDSESQPDTLVMTATPIPRTAAMTVYGDLEVSVLDEMPPGRTPIETIHLANEGAEGEVWEEVRAQVAAGRQAYVVCPLIEESGGLGQAMSAQQTYGELSAGELAGLNLALLHGKMSTDEKEAVMASFRAGLVDVLVSTTVIEVGVDVPNATVMVVRDADRFGMAQLHQLRGRVGRGRFPGTCYLLGDPTTPEGQTRLEALVASTDGFELAEVDLELRGEGTILGQRQKGRNDLRLASLRRDKEWVVAARQTAIELVELGNNSPAYRQLVEEIDFVFGEAEAEFLLKS